MLNTMMKNVLLKNTSFSNISIPFLRSYSHAVMEKKQVETTMGNSIYKINIECMKSGNNYRASDIKR